MIRIDLPALIGRLNDVCRECLEQAAGACMTHEGGEVTAAQFLLALTGRPTSDVSVALRESGINAENVRRALSSEPSHGAVARDAYPVFSPLLVELIQEAWLLGSLEMEHNEIRSGTVFLAALLNPHRYLPKNAVIALEDVNRESFRKRFNLHLWTSEEDREIQLTGEPSHMTSDDSALAAYGFDMTARARAGDIDPVLCRDREVDLMIDILVRRRKNNPMVVGEAGVGKSAVVEALALRIAQGQVPASLQAVALWALDLGALQAGAAVKGEFERRFKAVMAHVQASPHPIILFIDEAHTLIGAGNIAGGTDAANLLKPALARGELRTIAATTWSEYKRHIETDPALTRRFQLVKLHEPNAVDTVHILRGLRHAYEAAHGVYISDDALQAAASMSARYLTGRKLPDKAIDVVDTACGRVASSLADPPRRMTALRQDLTQIDAEQEHLATDKRMGRNIDTTRVDALESRKGAAQAELDRLDQAWVHQRQLIARIHELRADDETAPAVDADTVGGLLCQLRQAQATDALLHVDVGREQIAQVIADWTGIPTTTISNDRWDRIHHLPHLLAERVKGQTEAIATIHRHLLTSVADLRSPGKPIGSFLLTGPSGVGKTETALAIADALFGGSSFVTTINMSEYQEQHTVSRLLGSPPGYVGYGEGGVLTEAIRQRPYCVVLLDEVEKAHPDVLNIFYQAFDKGELVDGQGLYIDCKNVLFCLTSNLGFDHQHDDLAEPDADDLLKSLGHFFKPALLARMHVIPYRYLDAETLAEIVSSRLEQVIARVHERYGTVLAIAADVYEQLRARCIRHKNGARHLDAAIDGELLPPLSLALLGRMAAGEPAGAASLQWDGNRFMASVG